MADVIQYEVAWQGEAAPPWSRLGMTRKGDMLSLRANQLAAADIEQAARLRLVADLRGCFVDAVQQGLGEEEHPLLVTLDDWRAAWTGQRPCKYTTVVYIEVPDPTAVTDADLETTTYGPTIWSYRSGRADDLHGWSEWLRQNNQQQGRFVYDVPNGQSELPELVSVLSRALLDGAVTHLALAVANERQLATFGAMGSDLLAALGRRGAGIRLISCPTCARCRVDMRAMAQEILDRLPETEQDLEVSVMGCEVNGPGEGKNADLGIAIGEGRVTLFEEGAITERVPYDNAVETLLEAVRRKIDSKA